MRLPLLLLLAVALSAVEEGPFKVLKVIDGDTIEVMYASQPQASWAKFEPTRVRLLYVDTPEGTDNDHGKAMPEGVEAKRVLSLALPIGSQVFLWGPGAKLATDRYDRRLAVIALGVSENGAALRAAGESVQEYLVTWGQSPYWRKYGDADAPLHERLLQAQAEAEREKRGAWATAPDWMRDKANERTAPKIEK